MTSESQLLHGEGFFFAAAVFDARGGFVGEVDVFPRSRTVTLVLPLSLIADDGSLNVAVVTPQPRSSDGDVAPDARHGRLAAGDDYGWLGVDGTSGTVAPGDAGAMTVRAVPKGADAGTYRAALNVFSNDPLDAFARVPVTVEVRPHSVSATGRCAEHR